MTFDFPPNINYTKAKRQKFTGITLEQIPLNKFHLPSVTISNSTTPYAHLDDKDPITNEVQSTCTAI